MEKSSFKKGFKRMPRPPRRGGLPTRFGKMRRSSGFPEKQMEYLSYKEQYSHPLWQKRRLEVLEAAGWACVDCGNKDKTLNVHHKRYVKGRKVWEYTNAELASLCADCHFARHSVEDLLKEEVSKIDPLDVQWLVGFLIGRRQALLESNGVPERFAEKLPFMRTPPYNVAYVVGRIAECLTEWTGPSLMQLWAELEREPVTLHAHVVESVHSWPDREATVEALRKG